MQLLLKKEECKKEFIDTLIRLSNCDKEYALLEWEAIEEDWHLDFDNFDAEDTAREIISNWDF